MKYQKKNPSQENMTESFAYPQTQTALSENEIRSVFDKGEQKSSIGWWILIIFLIVVIFILIIVVTYAHLPRVKVIEVTDGRTIRTSKGIDLKEPLPFGVIN